MASTATAHCDWPVPFGTDNHIGTSSRACSVLEKVEPVGLGDVVEQAGALARNVEVRVQAELVDQVELHKRPPEADAAPDHDVAVADSPELGWLSGTNRKPDLPGIVSAPSD